MDRASGQLDLIAVEVIRHGLLAAAGEMKVALQRSAYNPIISEMHDFSVALFSAEAATVSQAPGIPTFLCDIPSAIHAIARDIGGFETFREGDVFLTNDPYANTNHVHDVNVVHPIFDDDSMVGFAGARAHWHDLGGSSAAGSMGATEIYQEGLILRSLRLYAGGVLNENVVRLIRENTRLPDTVLGDLRAQVGACRVGAERFRGLRRRYGAQVFDTALERILQDGELLARQRLSSLPLGTYEAESCLDDDGIDRGKPIRIQARVTIDVDGMTVDLSGSSGPVRGPYNTNANTAMSACRLIFKMLTTPHEPANEGHFRPLRVIIPERSLFRAQRPRATMLGFFALKTLKDVVKTAMGHAAPETVNAHDYGECTPVHVKGYDSAGRFFILPDTEGGGLGGSIHGDGESAIKGHDTVVIPVEVVEARYPVRIRRYVLRSNSAGQGRFRGGFGIIKEYEALVPVSLNAAYDRQVCPPQGLAGGKNGTPNELLILDRSGRAIHRVSKVTDLPVELGSVISLRTAGGGGFGSPSDRDPAQISWDLEEGLTTRDSVDANSIAGDVE